jgi:hypothetical protein
MTNLEGKVPPIDVVLTTTKHGVGISRLEIKDVREAEVPAALAVTKASSSEFRDGSPDEFWEKYMTNIEEAIMRAPATERKRPFSMESWWEAYCFVIGRSQVMIRKSASWRSFQDSEGPE